MAGKRDEVFLLGEEELGDEHLSAPAEEPTATAPLPGRSRLRPSRLRIGWPQVLAGALLLAALALLVRPGEEGADQAPSRVALPAPATVPIVRAPQPPEPAPERKPRRSRLPEHRQTSPKKPAPAPVAEAASAPVVVYELALEAAPEAPEATTAPPAPASPPPPPRPEFGIER
ncbi:MAG: hypothetical protein AB7V58_19400 [Solirubrobacterales bacterium]